jgi:hypothetical protein
MRCLTPLYIESCARVKELLLPTAPVFLHGQEFRGTHGQELGKRHSQKVSHGQESN